MTQKIKRIRFTVFELKLFMFLTCRGAFCDRIQKKMPPFSILVFAENFEL